MPYQFLTPPATGPPSVYGAWYIAILAIFLLWWIVFGWQIGNRSAQNWPGGYGPMETYRRRK